MILFRFKTTMKVHPETLPSASVALVVVEKNSERQILLLQRAHNLRDAWSGHLAFPGGKFEMGDRDLLATAIRETREECGIVLTEQDMVRALPVAPAGKSGKNPIWVQPWLFVLDQFPVIELDAAEMQGAFWLEAGKFQDLKNHGCFEPFPGGSFPCFWVENQVLWGFTYGVLCQYLGLDHDRAS